MNVLRTNAYIDHSKEINSRYALVPIVVYVFNKKDTTLSQEEINKIVKWFYYSQIRQRYISQLPQKLDKDINEDPKASSVPGGGRLILSSFGIAREETQDAGQ